MKLILFLLLGLSLCSLEEDNEFIHLTCTHSANAFLLDNMETLEWQFIIKEKSMETLTKEIFDEYLRVCEKNVSVDEAWKVN